MEFLWRLCDLFGFSLIDTVFGVVLVSRLSLTSVDDAASAVAVSSSRCSPQAKPSKAGSQQTHQCMRYVQPVTSASDNPTMMKSPVVAKQEMSHPIIHHFKKANTIQPDTLKYCQLHHFKKQTPFSHANQNIVNCIISKSITYAHKKIGNFVA